MSMSEIPISNTKEELIQSLIEYVVGREMDSFDTLCKKEDVSPSFAIFLTDKDDPICDHIYYKACQLSYMLHGEKSGK